MERPLTLKPITIQDENSVVHLKKVTLDGKSKISRPLARKGGVAPESRKALNDITNKSSIHPETTSQSKKTEKKRTDIVSKLDALSRKNISVNEKLNIAEEGFLHDHSKCIEAHKPAESEHHFWDTVLPGHDSTDLIMEQTKGDPDKCCPKLEELSMTEFSDCLKSCWKSPPSSPINRDMPYPSAKEFEAFDLVLKEDNYSDV